jgi:hypothetical protein
MFDVPGEGVDKHNFNFDLIQHKWPNVLNKKIGSNCVGSELFVTCNLEKNSSDDMFKPKLREF